MERVAWLIALAGGRPPRIARLRDGVGAGRFLHGEWGALLERFVDDGTAEYSMLVRVRRLIEAYLQRMAQTDPEAFADADDQLAFYLNAYNALALYLAAEHYPIGSIREIPHALVRVFAIGRHNVSLTILHGTVLRSFGDPRVHAAICPAARGAVLRQEPYLGTRLQQQLDEAMRGLLDDPVRGARYDERRNTLLIPAPLYTFGGDFVRPYLMPRPWGLLAARRHAQQLRDALVPYLPADLSAIVQHRRPSVRSLPFDWTLNDRDL